jgi:hypothetical protein
LEEEEAAAVACPNHQHKDGAGTLSVVAAAAPWLVVDTDNKILAAPEHERPWEEELL